MKNQDCFYDVFPKVLKVNEPATVTIRPKYDHVGLKADHVYSLQLSERETYAKSDITFTQSDGRILVTFTPTMEQEYTLLLTDSWEDGKRTAKTEFSLYAAEADLFACRPWKGDFHLHSCRSDGKESPVFVASNYRRAGFDFFALTDHHRYAPSLEVIEAFKKLETDFRVYPGEEVHPTGNCVHQVNFGGSFSVNEIFQKNPELYQKEVAEIEKTIDLPYVNDQDRFRLASSTWAFRKMREANGISIFSHPYWITGDHYNVSEALIRAFFEMKEFDAFELIGGFWKHQTEANSLQVSRWAEERSKGRKIPVVGISDSHGTFNAGLFNWYYTLVFAPTSDFADLRDAIRNDRSVAVHAIEDEAVQAHGAFRYVKFAYFCLREILPLHHDECAEEGRLMLKYFGGDESAAEGVARCKNRVRDLYKKLWA